MLTELVKVRHDVVDVVDIVAGLLDYIRKDLQLFLVCVLGLLVQLLCLVGLLLAFFIAGLSYSLFVIFPKLSSLK
jgi:hypothetical protein